MILKPYTLITLVLILLLACQNGTGKQSKNNDTDNRATQASVDDANAHEIENDEIPGISENLKAALKQLGLSQSGCNMSFFSEKVLPYSDNLSAMIIPKLSDERENYDYEFMLDAYIVLIDNESGKIKNKFFKANAWQSNMVAFLVYIKLDTLPYQLNADTYAFGIRAKYSGTSAISPYWHEEISLYTVQNDSLTQVLKDYRLSESHGELSNVDGSGEYKTNDRLIRIGDEKTDKYNNIIINTSSYKTYLFDEGENAENSKSDDNDCHTELTNSIKSTKTLKFNGTEYK